MANLSQFDLGSAARIGRVVKAVEQEPRRTKPLGFAPVIEAGKRSVFRVCTFTGSWQIGDSKTVTFKYQTTTPNTVSVVNLTMHLPDIGLSPPFDCEIAREGTAWYLVSSLEHTVKRGTFSAPWNKNSSKTVALVNGGSVTALNRHANIAGSGTKNCTVARDEMQWELIAAEC
jgi:hypothetical protein